MLESILLPAFSLGISATSIPGPMQAYLLSVTLRYGWKRGLLVILSPLITDGPIILVTVFLLGQLPDVAIQVIRIIGGMVLLWIAWGAYQQLRAGAQFQQADASSTPDDNPRKILGTAIAMNFFSPGPYLFWATVNGPLLLAALEISIWAAVGMMLAFYGTFLGGMVLLVILFNRLGKLGKNATRNILWLTIALLLFFGLNLIYAGISGLLLGA